MAGFAQVGVGIVHLGLWAEKLGAVTERLVTNIRKSAVSLGGALVVERYPAGFQARTRRLGRTGRRPAIDAKTEGSVGSAWHPFARQVCGGNLESVES